MRRTAARGQRSPRKDTGHGRPPHHADPPRREGVPTPTALLLATGAAGKSVGLYHDMRADEDFDVTADMLFQTVAAAIRTSPGAPRVLYFDITGHRTRGCAFDHDAQAIRTGFLIGFLSPYLSEIHTPLTHLRTAALQRDALPERLEIYEVPDHARAEAIRDLQHPRPPGRPRAPRVRRRHRANDPPPRGYRHQVSPMASPRQLPSGKWQAAVLMDNGRRITRTRTATTLKEADDWAARTEAQRDEQRRARRYRDPEQQVDIHLGAIEYHARRGALTARHIAHLRRIADALTLGGTGTHPP